MVLPRSVDSELHIPLEKVTLKGRFRLPENPKGIILFSHGSGSSRKSPRNNYVAEILYQQGLGSLLFDLLTEEEDQVYENRFNIGLLTRRLITVTDWVLVYAYRPNLPLGYFGASTGAASALRAAAHFREKIAAVVCRGGRPDLAMADLPRVTAPTLFLVGSLDHPVIELNRQAVALMRSDAELELVPGATHLFAEPGKLDLVAEKTAAWFQTHFEKKRAYV
ncbi:dienelactone hydrolase family protein [Robiginitalea marina]|uniref:Dienelactone hydrolase family protein n=1 Tax=Robiginitalea marina TaxID=2954105 RepID=A0ABT1ATM8_9FLAO|nr:dienelactone hydrolase family protein [Robiginitalea marina]MCO5723257.1 dienelactone hydrolase family protein [Robiginitalea marina]